VHTWLDGGVTLLAFIEAPAVMGKGSALSAWQPDNGLLTRLVVLDDGRVEQRSLSNCARSAIEYRNGCGPWAGTKVLEDLTRDGCSARRRRNGGACLNHAGHTVTVFEKDEALGGLLRFGIPDFKMEKSVIDRRVKLLEAEGITFKTGVTVPWHELKATHDGVVLGIGARAARELNLPGRELSGVVQAMDYLEVANRRMAKQTGHEGAATGKRVVILGGGDTGSDCLGTALREGATDVSQLELMPLHPNARPTSNPWPQWPLVFRTSSSQEEGGLRSFGFMTKRLIGESGKLVAIEGVEVTLENGALVEHPESTRRVEVDLLILALGFTGPDTSTLTKELGVALDPRGNVKVDRDFATNVKGLYAAGDAMRGASLIVWAISDGREAARAVDSFLTGAPSSLPTRGRDAPFGGR
jgi:glutamate synthase (NADPH/NADH) small chain